MRPAARLLLLSLLNAALALPADPSSFETTWKRLKATLSSEDLYRLLWALPKGGDLHNHHEYSIPMTFWQEGAARRGYLIRTRIGACGEKEPIQWLALRLDSVAKLPTCPQHDFQPASTLSAAQRQAWLAALMLDPSEARDEFFDHIVLRLGDLERDPVLIADALLLAQRQLQDQNALYLETQLDPRGFNAMSEDQGAAAIRHRLATPEARATGITVRMQVSSLRFLPGAEDDLKDGFAFVHRNRDLWAGVNLVGREDNPDGRPARFAKVLSGLRRQYPDVHLSLHAGESSQPDSNVADTLALGAERIGHGTNAYLDPSAMRLLRTGRYLIEVSLLSNLELGYTPDLHRHPLPTYLRAGIPVCLNTDDLGIMDSNLTDEYLAAVSLFDLTWAEVVQLGRWSLEFSFTEASLKRELLTRYDGNVAAFKTAYSSPGWQRNLQQVNARPSGSTARVFKMRKQLAGAGRWLR